MDRDEQHKLAVDTALGVVMSIDTSGIADPEMRLEIAQTVAEMVIDYVMDGYDT